MVTRLVLLLCAALVVRATVPRTLIQATVVKGGAKDVELAAGMDKRPGDISYKVAGSMRRGVVACVG